MNAKSLYRKFLNISSKIFGPALIKKFDARFRFHRIINLKEPVTLSDKLCWLELYRENPVKIECSDKYAVRDYVKGKGLEEILVPLCAPVCTKVEDIDFDKLPNQFAMKAAHGCEMNLICDDKSKLDIEETKKTAKKWLKKDYERACIEPHYKKIPHRIIFEKYLQDADKIIDYKIHCFHGQPNFVLVCVGRAEKLKLQLYTLDWQRINGTIGKKKCDDDFEKPRDLDRMLEISKILSADFDFVRVDLYDINGKVYFGELTFSPASGVLPNFSEEFVREKGKLLNIQTDA